MSHQTAAAITPAEARRFPPGAVGPLSGVDRPAWQMEVAHRLRQLEKLEHDWDRRGSAAVSGDALTFAFTILHTVMPPNGPTPEIHALGHGGLQLSWSSPHGDLDLEVIAPNKLLVCFDRHIGQPEEWAATNELSRLQSVLWAHFKG